MAIKVIIADRAAMYSTHLPRASDGFEYGSISSSLSEYLK